MKELSIKEKAQRYDEAIKYAHYLINERCKEGTNGSFHRADLDKMFPELTESEDKRIIKAIIEIVKKDEERIGTNAHLKKIQWLEKQGEHANFRNKIQIGDKVTRDEDGELVNLSQLNRVAKKDEKQGEQSKEATYTHEVETGNGNIKALVTEKVQLPKFKVGDTIRLKNSNAEYIIESIDDSHYYGKGFSISIVGGNRDYELVEHNPAWSKENKEMFGYLEDIVNFCYCNQFVVNVQTCEKVRQLVFRLKSLCFQSGWGKDDITRINEIIETLNIVQANRVRTQKMHYNKATIDKNIDWLKSLKERVQPQPSWKPTYEQVEALQESIGIVGELTPRGEFLKELVEQLKKLREE